MVRQVNIWKYIAALKGLTREFDRSSGLLNIARTAEVVNCLFYMVPHSHPHASGLSVWHRMKIKSHANSFKDYARFCNPPCREDVMLQSITKYLRLNLVFI